MAAGPELEVESADGTRLRLPIAGPGARSYAFTIDWHVRILVALAWALVAILVLGTPSSFKSLVESHGTLQFWLIVGIPIAIYLLYHPVLEIALRGHTPGKNMAGVRLVNRAGLPPSRGALLLRNLLRVIDALPAMYAVGLAVCVIRDDQQRLGDLVAGTVLVYGREVEQSDFDDRALGAAVAPDVAIASELLTRWDTLAAASRRALAASLIARRGMPADGGDDELRAALLAIRDGR
jgi:uncharacterized RDD family membrane protein YckC